MSKILFLTNMEQTATYLQDALKLAQQTQEAVAGQVLYVSSDTEWTRDMEKQLQQAEVVIFPWMGTGLSTKFLSESSSYLLANKKKHVYLMTGNPEDILHGGLSEEELKRINDYINSEVCRTGQICGCGWRSSFCRQDVMCLLPSFCRGMVFIIRVQVRFIMMWRNIAVIFARRTDLHWQ